MNIVQISCLGNLGRFGNMLGQFLTAKTYAESINTILEIPENWIGNFIFDINEKTLTSMNCKHIDESIFSFDDMIKSKGVDLYGFFQHHRFYKHLSISKCREWLKIKDKWINKFPKKREFYICCNLRRGDMKKMHWSYPTIKEESYINALNQYGYDLNDVIWVSDDFPEEDEECKSLGIDFLPDFMTIYNSDVLFRANSTFSFWAGLLGNCKMYSPLIDFPSYSGLIGPQNTEFILGLGKDKEGYFKE